MSNQRAGKTYRAAAQDDSREMNLYKFFKTAQQLLEQQDQDDAAFCFEQMAEHLREGKSLPTTESEISRLLGL